MKSVDVVIPVYGNWETVRQCLMSLNSQSNEVNIIVVDDCSPDDTAENIVSSFPNIRLIQNSKNLGFAKTCNRGIASGDSDLVVLVNSDVVADRYMVENLQKTFEENPEVGSATPLLLKPNGLVDGFGITVDSTLSGFVRYSGRTMEQLREYFPPVLAAYGAVAAFRRKALDQVGLLDENIFMYGEELDLGLRLIASGWKSEAVISATGVHIGGASIGLGSPGQREKSGFGRGYILKSYGVLKTRFAARALVTEVLVCIADTIIHRDLAAIRGRILGWKVGRYAPEKPKIKDIKLADISFLKSMRLRSSKVMF